MTTQTTPPDPHAPPPATILHLSLPDTDDWHKLPAYQQALINLARRLSPFVIKSADRKILYRAATPPADRTDIHISISYPTQDTPSNAPILN